MVQQVKAYGQILQFPDGMSEDDMAEAIRSNEPDLNPDYKAPTPEALDYAKGFASGANKLVSGVGYLAEAAGAKDTGKSIREFGDRGAAYWNEQMSPGGKKAAESQVFVDDPESITGLRLGDDAGKALLMGAAQSLPSMFAAALPGVAITKGIQALASLGLAGGAGATIPLLAGTAAPVGIGSQVIARVPSAVGFGAAEGVVSGGMNAAGLKSSIEGMSDKELLKSPVYQALRAQHGEEKARTMLADQAASDLFGKTAVSTGTIGALTGGGALGSAYQKVTSGAADGILMTGVKGAGQEAIQETPQSGGEKYIENITRKEYLDPSVDPMSGVIAEAASGGAIGAFTGGIVGAGSAINITKQKITPIADAPTLDDAIVAAHEAIRTEDPTLADVEALNPTKKETTDETQTTINTGQAQAAEILDIVLPDNSSVKAEWKIVDADQLAASMKEDVNQPRDRTRAASDVQIKSIANAPDYRRLSDSPVMDVGAPVVDQDGRIVAGNGRFAGLSQAYEQGTATEYINQLREDAARKGLSIEGIAKPVLVRQLSEPVDTRKMAIASNSGTTLQMSALEQANLDAERMKGIENLDVNDLGDIALTPRNLTQLKDSLGSYAGTELGAMVDKGGQLSQEGMRRVRNAMLAKAYGSSPTLEKLVESTDTDMRNVLGALTKSANHIIKTKGDVKPLMEAVDTYSQLKATGQPVDNFLAQQDAFSDGLSKEAEAILRFIDTNVRSQKKLTDFFKGNFVEVDTTSDDMFAPKLSVAPKDKINLSEGSDIRETRIGDSTLVYGYSDGKLKLYSIRTPQAKRGAGSARRAMETFVTQADRENKTIFLDASALDKKTSTGKLVAFYKSLGFELTGKKVNPLGEPEMKRSPNAKDTNVKQLEKHLKDNGYDFTVEPASVRDVDALDSTKKARKELAEKQAKLFKKKVVFVKADGPFKINGVMVPSIADTIFVDIRTDKAFDAIMAHELSHWMEQEKPAVYKELVKSLKKVIVEDATEGYAKKYGIEGATKAEITKEIVGDLMGDSFTEQSFWQKVAEANPKAFKDIAAAIIKWLKGVIVKAKANGMGSEQWVKDATKAQDIIAKAVAQYTESESAPVSAESRPKFNVTGDSKSDIDKARVILNRLSDLHTKLNDTNDIDVFVEFGERAVEAKSVLSSMLESGRLNGIGADGDWFVSRNTTSDKPWRITFFGATDGQPFSHTEYKTAKQALSDNNLIIDKSKVALFSRAYHGSPHDHNKFESSKIGTGEGAQAYGYGHYFAESKDVAEYYKDQLSDNTNGPPTRYFKGERLTPGTPEYHAGTLLSRNGMTLVKARSDVRGWIAEGELDERQNDLVKGWKRTLELLEIAKTKKDFTETPYKGKLYEVELAPEQDEYLLWDKPLSEQSDKVKSALGKLPANKVNPDGLDMGGGSVIRDNRNGKIKPGSAAPWVLVSGDSKFDLTQKDVDRMTKDLGTDSTGENIYSRLTSTKGSQKSASEYLHSLGIRGIKYLDGSSRAKGEGAYNYVIFDDKDVSITAKFSRAEKTLIAQHNLSVRKLIHADRMGALAVPSIAVTDKAHPLTGFGEITLLADEDFMSDARTFGADIYSTRYPEVSYDFSIKDIQKLNDRFKDEKSRLGESDFYSSNMDDPQRIMKESPAVAMKFLESEGIKPRIKLITTEEKPATNVLKWVKSPLDRQELTRDPKFIDDVKKDYIAQFKDVPADEMEGLLPENDDQWRNIAVRQAFKVTNYRESLVNKGKVDLDDTRRALTEQIRLNKRSDKFNAYIDNIITEVNPKQEIFDKLTNTGTGRKYIEHNLDNVIRKMRSSFVGGENFGFGLGKIRGVHAPEFKSIEQIRKNKSRLMNSKDFEAVKADVGKEMDDLFEQMNRYGTYSGFDNAGQAVFDSAKMGIPKALTYNGFKNVPDDVKSDIATFIEKLRNMPTEYFEAKVLRGVKLGEFKAAIVPKDIPQEALDILKKNGIEDIRKYKSGDNEDRVKQINKVTHVMFSRAPKLYSKLEQALEAANDKVFSTGPQVKLWLQSNAGKLGIKKDEIYWSGIDNWLDAQGKVSKQQVVEFVRNNGVQVEDVTLGGSIVDKTDAIYSKLNKNSRMYWALDDSFSNGEISKDEFDAKKDELLKDKQALDDELRVVLDSSSLPKHNNDKLTLPGGTDYKELVVTVPTIEPHNADDSTHFGDTGQGKQIGWLRMDTRDGGLFIEELQSQRAQQGRSKGFGSLTQQERDELISLDREAKELGDKVYTVSVLKRNAIEAELLTVNRRRADLRDKVRKSVPPAPFVSDANQKATNAYITLLMKKALIEAVSNDHASVSWTTGDQQADRYDLSKQINMVSAISNNNGTYNLIVEDKSGNEIEPYSRSGKRVTPAEMEEVIGKDLTKKVVAGADLVKDKPWPKSASTNPAFYRVRGVDLKIGGEWAQSMYGNEQGLNLQGKPSLISQAANDIFKHVGSGKVESINGQPGFYVTPEMKSKDLPLFSFAGPKAETADKYALETAQQRIAAGDPDDTVRQETGWFKGVDGKWRFEINDSDASIKKPFPAKGQRFGDVYKSVYEAKLKEGYAGIALGDILDHPKLFAAYPRLADLSIDTQKGSGASFRVSTSLSPSMIEIGEDVLMYDALSTLLHEIQHGIQRVEGFANGGSVESARRAAADIVGAKLNEINGQIIDLGKNRIILKGEEYTENVRLHKLLVEERNKLEDSLEGLKYDMAPATKAYNRLAGEVEARNTQTRIGFNDEERRLLPPYSSQDTPDSDQIIVYNGVEMRSEPSKPTPPDESRLRRFQRMNQDSFNRFTVIKEWLAENGQTLSDKADVYGAEERYHSMAANQLEDFREQQRNPLIEKIQKAGYTLGDIEVFLKMQHAQEANAQIRKLGDNPDATAYGITDQEAADYLSEAPENLGKLANQFRDITEQTKKLRLDAGILNTDITDAWEGAYKHYVPVKGEADSTRGVGKGLKTNFKSKRRLGHSLRDEHVIENILMDHERAILEVERNRVGKHLVMMAAEMQRPDILSIEQPEKRKMLKESTAYTVEANGVVQGVFKSREEAKMFKQFYAASMPKVAPSAITINQTKDQRVIASASPMLAENEVNVYMNGHAIRVQIKDEWLARAYTKMGVEQFSDIVGAGRILNGYLSKVYTGYNPEFILTNMIRDFSSGTINLTGEQGFSMATKALTNYPRMFTDLLKYAATNGKSSTKWIDAYRKNGGNTGAAYLSDMERLGNEVNTEYASYQGVLSNLKQGDTANAARAAGRKVFNATLKWIYNLNQAGENAMRLAAFKAMIDSGRTVNEAAKVAKNITVNFNRKGERQWAPALYLFYNASVQGTAATGHALTKGKHKGQAWALAGSMAAVGYMMAASFGGGDEDDWDEINEYTKERNMLIKSGDGYVKVPVPYGYGFFWNFGRHIAEAQRTGELGTTPWHLATSAISEFTPFNEIVVGSDEEFRSDQVFMGLLPTAMKIVAQPTFNKQLFTGSELMPESQFDKSQPDRQKMFRSTKGTMYDTVAGWLDSAGIDVSPETLKYITRTGTGGAGSLVDTGISAAMLKAEGAELDTQEIPFVRKAYMELGIKDKRAAYHKVREEARTAAEEFNRARRDNDVAKMQTVLKDKNELMALDRYANKLAATIDAARDQQDAVRADKNLSVQEKRLKLKDMEATEAKFYDQYLDVFKAQTRRKQ